MVAIRPSLARLMLAVGVAAAFFLSAARAQTVILARHAEQDRSVAGNDQPLSAAGKARAQALADAVAGAGVTVVLTSPLKRTVETAAPAAAAAGVTSRAIPIGANHIAEVVAAARAAGPKGVVLIVGHSNTTPGIVAALGGRASPNLDETIYDTLWTLQLDGAKAVEVKSRYGSPEPGPPPPPAPPR